MAQSTFDPAQARAEELVALQQEVGTLATELNRLNSLRLIRIFHAYRRLRRRLTSWVATSRRWRTGGHEESAPPQQAEAGYDVIFLSCADWRWRFQRPQHLSKQWAEHGHRVFFVDPDFRSMVNPRSGHANALYSARQVLPNVFEVYLAGPTDLRPLQERMTDDDAQGMATACSALAQDFGVRHAVCVLELPFWRPLAEQLRAQHGWKIIYDLIDRWHGILPMAHAMLSEEAPLLKQADGVVVTARILRDQAQDTSAPVALIPNGADVEHFAHTPTGGAARRLGVQGPVIGYFGNLAPWLDVELVEQCARDHPGWTFVLVGSGQADVSALKALSNVRLIGELAYAELPSIVHQFDVCIIPFRLLPVTAATDPVKFYEYLASGRPVVSTALPELEPYGEHVYLARDAPSFGRLIAQALAEDNEQRQASRREFAVMHSWSNRYVAFDQLIREIDVPRRDGSEPIEGNGMALPIVLAVSPWSVRSGDISAVKLNIHGRNLTPQCVVLVDEIPLTTDFVSTTELRCMLPLGNPSLPGTRMVSVLDHATWRQSNRRLFIVLSV